MQPVAMVLLMKMLTAHDKFSRNICSGQLKAFKYEQTLVSVRQDAFIFSDKPTWHHYRPVQEAEEP